MEFNLSEERQMLKDTAERLIREQYPIEKRHEAAASETGFSREMWREFADLGLIGALIPPEFDGFGSTGEDIALVFEALGRGVVVEPFLASALASGPLIEAGDAETLAAVMAGETVVALAHGEPDSRYSMSRVSTQATESADGWRLSGAKSVVINGDKIPVERLHQVGVINRLYEPDQALETALELAGRLADGPTQALGTGKRLIDQSRLNELKVQLDQEAEGIATALGGAEGAEGINAFPEKRKPDFGSV